MTNQKCNESPDSLCHYNTTSDRDGISCIELNDGTLDHNFPRKKWDQKKETKDLCLYCGDK